jgi:hypothetical protein
MPIDTQVNERGNRVIRRARAGETSYRGYAIKPKQDFGSHGHLIDGFFVKEGYIVCDEVCAIMPGATWFQTVDDAMRAIDDLIEADDMEHGQGEHPFWALNRFRHQAEEHAPRLALMLQEILDRVGRQRFEEIAGVDAADLLDQIDDNCDMRTRSGPVGGPYERLGERTTGRFGLPKEPLA